MQCFFYNLKNSLRKRWTMRFKSSHFQKIKAVQSNNCTAFMVGATGPDRLASLAVSGNNFMSLLLRKRWTVQVRILTGYNIPKKQADNLWLSALNGRSDRIRTCGILLPNRLIIVINNNTQFF